MPPPPSPLRCRFNRPLAWTRSAALGHTTVFQAIERGIARSGCDFLILTRPVPLFPYNIQNYAYGLTAIRFWPFTLISAVTTLPGLVIYSVMASELAREG